MFRYVLVLLFSFNVLAKDVTLSLSALQDSEYGVVGSVAPLNWQAPLPMTKVGDTWSLRVNLDDSAQKLEYKYVLLSENTLRFEPITGPRSLDLSQTNQSSDQWSKQPFEGVLNITAAEANADIDALEQAIIELHQKLGIIDNDLAEKTQQLKSKLYNNQQQNVWYRAIKEYLYANTDGIFDIRLGQQEPSLQRALLDKSDKLPFEYEFVGKKMFVSKSPYPEQLPIGSEILKLNQKFVWQVLELFKDVGVESHFQQQLGAAQAYQVPELDLQLAAVLPPLANGFVVTYQGKKKPKTEYLPASTWPGRQFVLNPNLGTTPEQVSWNRNMQTNDIAYIQITSSKDLPLPNDWQDYLSQSLEIFTKNKVPNIILDLRKMEDDNVSLYLHIARLFGRSVFDSNEYTELNVTEHASNNHGEMSVTGSHNKKRLMVIYPEANVYLLYGASKSKVLGQFLSSFESVADVISVGSPFEYDSTFIPQTLMPALSLKNSGFVVSKPTRVWRNENNNKVTKKVVPALNLTKSISDVKQNRDGLLLKLIGHIKQTEQ